LQERIHIFPEHFFHYIYILFAILNVSTTVKYITTDDKIVWHFRGWNPLPLFAFCVLFYVCELRTFLRWSYFSNGTPYSLTTINNQSCLFHLIRIWKLQFVVFWDRWLYICFCLRDRGVSGLASFTTIVVLCIVLKCTTIKTQPL